MKHEIAIQDIASKLNFTVENTYKLLDIFYDSSNTLLDNIEASILNNDFDKIYRNAHSIKGSSSNLLFNNIYNIAKEIEHCAKEELEYPYLEKVNEIRTLLKETKITKE